MPLLKNWNTDMPTGRMGIITELLKNNLIPKKARTAKKGGPF
jgi:hypothetical protein